MSEGDQNTKYFHRKATTRQERNKMKGLEDDDGNWFSDDKNIERISVNFFKKIFSSEGTTDVKGMLENMKRNVTEQMNNRLLEEFTKEEVYKAVMQMHPLKAPGPDSLPALFFQKFWDIIGEDITREVLKILKSGNMPNSLNHTHLTPIPKTKSPTKITEYRPISLFNVTYKIISKMLSNRMKLMLDKVISEAQSAFIPGRLITGNILVAFETMHHIKARKQGRKGLMAFKLDMTKAYDRVEWKFLEKFMIKMGFD